MRIFLLLEITEFFFSNLKFHGFLQFSSKTALTNWYHPFDVVGCVQKIQSSGRRMKISINYCPHQRNLRKIDMPVARRKLRTIYKEKSEKTSLLAAILQTNECEKKWMLPNILSLPPRRRRLLSGSLYLSLSRSLTHTHTFCRFPFVYSVEDFFFNDIQLRN